MMARPDEGAHGRRTPTGLKRLLLRLFRVEEQPEPPPGSPESLRTFRASPRFFRYSVLKWALGQGGAILGLIVSAFGFGFVNPETWTTDVEPFDRFRIVNPVTWTTDIEPLDRFLWFTQVFAPLLIILFLVQLVASFVVLRLGYEMRWYMVSDRALRIRYGIYSLREQTLTVVNIQNMAVKRGPLQRLFGIADLEIRTASGGGSDDDDEDSLSRGLLQGLDNAEEVRNLLLASLRQSRDAGLGDPDDRSTAPAVPASSPGAAAPAGEDGGSVLAAARELLAESRALRRAVAGSGS